MMLRIAGASLNQTPLKWGMNTARILIAIESAKKERADILCFQELCISGYGCEDLHLTDWLSEQAWKELEKVIEVCDTDLVVCIGIPLRIDGYTYNGACVIQNRKILGITLKQNLARDGVHYEPRWFEPWTAGQVITIKRGARDVEVGDLIYEAKGIRFGFEICEDAWREVRPGEGLSRRNVDLIINPSASHFALGKSDSREALVKESSERFNCVYVYVNVLGNEAGRMIYDGDIIVAQKGKLLLTGRRLSFKAVQVQCCAVDFADPSKSQQRINNEFKDRNEEFTQAVSLALFDYLEKSIAGGFVLSLSGGADSSTCAVLVAEMAKRGMKELGWESFSEAVLVQPTREWKQAMGLLLTCAYQGTVNSSAKTLNAAATLAKSIGAEFHEWKVDDEVASYTSKVEAAMKRKLRWDFDDIALQNIQARARSPVIWMLANVKRAILLTTSNRSEGDVGYATMDGDTSGSLAPIAGIDKPFILQWLKWAETHLGYESLKAVNLLEPTAELRPSSNEQTDEKDLMPYIVLLEIERHALLGRLSPAAVYKKMKERFPPMELKGYIKKFFQRWAANQWKRERLAPSFHLDDLNVDPRSWCRFPILSGGFEEELKELDKL